MLDPFRNIGKELTDVIEKGHYFVIHSAKLSGKTTLLMELADKINAEGKYHALYCSLDCAQDFSEPEKSIPVIIKTIKYKMETFGLPSGFADNEDYKR